MKNSIVIGENPRKILIIGANGFLGSHLLYFRNKMELLDQNISLIASDLERDNIPLSVPFYHINITNSEQTYKKITTLSPDIIILTAAMTNVDQCETDKILASKINVKGPHNVIKACKKVNSKLVFISTDFIFDGMRKKGESYIETDLPNPLSHYGKTKYEAELAIYRAGINYLICRTAILYGWNVNKFNFVSWILNILKENKRISIVNNEINSPTFVLNLAQIIFKLIEKNAQGIYHTAGDFAMTRYEIALKCAEIFNYNKNLILPIDHFERRAVRPKNVGLDVSKLKKILGSELKILSLHDGLIYMKNNPVII